MHIRYIANLFCSAYDQRGVLLNIFTLSWSKMFRTRPLISFIHGGLISSYLACMACVKLYVLPARAFPNWDVFEKIGMLELFWSRNTVRKRKRKRLSTECERRLHGWRCKSWRILRTMTESRRNQERRREGERERERWKCSKQQAAPPQIVANCTRSVWETLGISFDVELVFRGAYAPPLSLPSRWFES